MNIVEWLKVCPPCIPFDDVPSIFEVEETIKNRSNRNAVGPHELQAKLFKLMSDEDHDGKSIYWSSSTLLGSPCGEVGVYRKGGNMPRS